MSNKWFRGLRTEDHWQRGFKLGLGECSMVCFALLLLVPLRRSRIGDLFCQTTFAVRIESWWYIISTWQSGSSFSCTNGMEESKLPRDALSANELKIYITRKLTVLANPHHHVYFLVTIGIFALVTGSPSCRNLNPGKPFLSLVIGSRETISYRWSTQDCFVRSNNLNGGYLIYRITFVYIVRNWEPLYWFRDEICRHGVILEVRLDKMRSSYKHVFRWFMEL